MTKFNLDEQFALYLKRMGLIMENLPLDQLTEMKRSFIGGVSQLHRFLADDNAGEENEEDGILAIVDLEDQLQQYWIVQTLSQ